MHKISPKTRQYLLPSQKRVKEGTGRSPQQKISSKIAIKSTKRLIDESMFVQLLRATLHKDVLKPRNI